MQDLIITIDRDTRKVKTNRSFLGLCGENLQGDIIVEFTDKAEFVDGTAHFYYCYGSGGNTGVPMTKDSTNKIYTTPIKSSMLSGAGQMNCQIKIEGTATSSGSKPIFKSEVFKLSCFETVAV